MHSLTAVGAYFDRDLKPLYVTNEKCDQNCKENKMDCGSCTDLDCICDYPALGHDDINWA